MRYFLSSFFGAVLGFGAVVLHNAFVPWGLIIALSGSGAGIWLVGRAWGLRRYKTIVAGVWLLVLLRASALGVGGELLVMANAMGAALIYAGLAIAMIAVAAPC